MTKTVTRNETMSDSLSAFQEYNKNRKKGITLHLRGPKGMSKNMKLAKKPSHPKSEDIFNSTNSSMRGGSIAVEFNEITNSKNFFDLILENKNKIYFVEELYTFASKNLQLYGSFTEKLKKFQIIGFLKIDL